MEITMEEPNEWELAMKKSLLAKSKLAIVMKGHNGIVQYSCVECDEKYDDKEDLEKHLLVHNKEYRFLCGICGTGLKRKEHLDRHTMEHQELRPHICPDCGKAFKRKEHLNIHRSIHSGSKSQSCPVCDKAFYRKDHLRKHVQTHSKAYVEYKASLNMEYVDVKVELLDEDIKQEADEQYEEMLESQDNEDSDQKEYLNSNQVSGLSIVSPISNERPFQCPICQKSYKRKDHLKIHSWTHMKKDKVCADCGKGFHTEDQLLTHMTVHLRPYGHATGNGDEEPQMMDAEVFSPVNGLLIAREEPRQITVESRPHECVVCHRRFKRKQHLKVHMNTHNKHQPSIWCSVCGEGFFANQAFEEHHCLALEPEITTETYDDSDEQAQTAPHEAKKENKYPQEFADIEILSEMSPQEPNGLEIHYPEEQSIPMPQKVFVCKYCSKPFKRKDHYKIHLHIHTGVKSFFCPECGRGFYRKDHMQKHIMVHNKAKQPPKKELPDLFPIKMFKSEPKKASKEIIPEITIHAPSNTKLRVPLQIRVPYQMVMSLDNGEQRAVTIDPAGGEMA